MGSSGCRLGVFGLSLYCKRCATLGVMLRNRERDARGPVFRDGMLLGEQSLAEIRERGAT